MSETEFNRLRDDLSMLHNFVESVRARITKLDEPMPQPRQHRKPAQRQGNVVQFEPRAAAQ
jgi:hypothetical protein